MWWKQGTQIASRYQREPRVGNLIDSSFQLRHALFLLVAMNLPVFVLLGFSFYFLSENYLIFKEMAYRYAPALVPHLDREKQMLFYIYLSGGLGLGIYTFFIGIRTTARLVGPVFALRRHLRNLIRGDWGQDLLRVREQDDYHDLVDTYNYFYSSLLRQSQWELEQLQKLKIAKHAPESQQRHQALVHYKAAQLGLEGIESHDDETKPELRALS